MSKTYQFKEINMLMHGEMVFNEYKKLIEAIKEGNFDYFKEIRFSFEEDFIKKLYSLQYDMDTMKSYQIYHDCGKHISKYVDENGKIHYPDHAKHSANVYNQYFDNIIAEDLILKDLNFHTFKCEELIEWIKEEKKEILASLYLTAWAEILVNSTMFGGRESDSFKIKRKKLIQAGKKLKEILK